jgi:hypothetical protein
MKRLLVLLLPLILSAPPALADVDGVWHDFMPPTRRGATLSYDTTRDRCVLFGGEEQVLSREVWEFDVPTSRWTKLDVLGRLPLPRRGSASVYDPLHDRVWMFGGATTLGPQSGMWGLDASPEEWVQLPQPPPPSARTNAALVYDGTRGRVVLYGGQLSTLTMTAAGDVWALSPSDSLSWMRLVPTGTAPEPRWDAVVVYDSPRDRLVILGGRNRDSVFTDAWELRFTPTLAWGPLTAFTGRAPAREGMLGALDLPNHRIVTFGGTDPETKLAVRDVWSFELAGLASWTKTTPTGDIPAELSEACAVLDSARARVVVHGGGRRKGLDASYPSNETWALDIAGTPAWTRLVPALKTPIPRYGQATAYDAGGDAFWIFGGRSSRDGEAILSDETWRAPLGAPGTWSEIAATGERPPPRQEAAGAFDGAGRRLVVFGGWDGSTYFGDTWALAADAPYRWMPFAPGPAPSPRRAHASMYDPTRRALVIYGGVGPDSSFSDVWSLAIDGAGAWRRIEPQGERPDPRAWASAVFDAAHDRMIVYGGSIDGQSTRELWALSLGAVPRWTRLEAAGEGPPGLQRHVAVYDARRRRMLVWAGFTSDDGIFSSARGVWALALDGAPTWSLLKTEGPDPQPATAPSTVYDARRDRMVTYGGSDVFDYLIPDFRGLDLNPFATGPVPAWFAGARLAPEGVHLLWQSDAPTGTLVLVEKRIDLAGGGLPLPGDAPPGTWDELGSERVGAGGEVAWLDPRALGGGTYSYRLILPEGAAGEVVIEIPVSVRFAFAGATPSPTTGTMALTLFSTGLSSVRAELFDVRGRRVESRSLGMVPAGPQSVAFDFGNARRAGIYFLRVTQGTDSATRKIVLLR